jgi:hypothetical protein
VLLGLAAGILLLILMFSVQSGTALQIPTGSVPTVTGSPLGAVAIVLDNEQGFANVRSGPGTLGYEIVGVLVVGQQVSAFGRTVVGDWILIEYPGVPGGTASIWKDLVEIRGSLPVIQPPPTYTPAVTPTLDPTLAAQFLVDLPPTRLPTFTAPPALLIPTFVPEDITQEAGRIPMGMVIIVLFVLGSFGVLISFLRGR